MSSKHMQKRELSVMLTGQEFTDLQNEAAIDIRSFHLLLGTPLLIQGKRNFSVAKRMEKCVK